MEQALIILGKYPTIGKVKSRLSKEIGEIKASNIYKQWLENLFKETSEIKNITLFFLYSDLGDKKDISNWLENSNILLVDPFSNDIEENLTQGFEYIFSLGFKKVISIASDVPGLSTEIIKDSFNSLSLFDVVIGPDKSGGIYLYGAKNHYPELFESENRDGSKIFDETIKIIKEKKLSYLCLEKLIDVDTKKDLDELQRLN